MRKQPVIFAIFGAAILAPIRSQRIPANLSLDCGGKDHEFKGCVQQMMQDMSRAHVDLTALQSALGSGSSVNFETASNAINGTKFEQVCEIMLELDSCFQQNQINTICPDNAMLKMLEGTFFYFCKEPHKKKFLETMTCLSRLKNRADPKSKQIDECLKESAQNQTRDACKLMNSVLVCGQAPISEECGDESFEILVTLAGNSMELIDPKCHITIASISKTNFHNSKGLPSAAGNIFCCFSNFLSILILVLLQCFYY